MMPKNIQVYIASDINNHKPSRSNIIYLTCIVITIFTVAALPFITLDVSVHSSALIRPTTEISIIRPLINGRVKESFIKENQSVQKGDVLYVIESEPLIERERFSLAKKQDVEYFIHDLNSLIHLSNTEDLTTSLYQQSYYNYQQKVIEVSVRLKKTQTDYNRNFKLHSQKVIADSEFETHQFELDKAKNDLEILKQTQLSQWQSELRSYEKELQEIESQLAQVVKEKENSIIKAPISGSVQNLAGIYSGSMVFANQDLAQISPDTNLIVEAYVNPNDIGLLQKGMPTRFQVDAFNYNQWGLATGKVLEISNDIHVINERPVFKVKCILDKDFLQLKNGYKGYLKKGMTLQARFMVTERTLWQLLYDKADDWLNPNTFTGQNF